MICLMTFWYLINVPPLINFENFSHPQTLLGPPVYSFSQISILATVKFSNIWYQLKVLWLISMWHRYILVEHEWISPDVGMNSHLIFRYFFPIKSSPPAYLDPPLIKFSRFFQFPYCLVTHFIRHCRVKPFKILAEYYMQIDLTYQNLRRLKRSPDCYFFNQRKSWIVLAG